MHDAREELVIASMAILVSFWGGCAMMSTGMPRPSAPVLFDETFDDLATFAQYWVADFSPSRSTRVQTRRSSGDGSISLELVSDTERSDVSIHHAIDLTNMRGLRIRLSARIRTSAPATTSAIAKLSLDRPLNGETYFDSVETPAFSSKSWKTMHAVLDVPSVASDGKLSLVLRGPGVAWFDDIVLTSLGPSPDVRTMQLSQSLKGRLITMTRALALVHYFHPSDESATTDWNEFLIRAMDNILQAPSEPFAELLRRVLTPVAPSVQIYTNRVRPMDTPRDPRATHLARWVHFGLGSDDSAALYLAMRDGIDGDENAATYAYTAITLNNMQHCGNVEIRMPVRSATGSAWLLASLLQPAQRTSYIKQQISTSQGDLVARSEVPPNVQQVRLGVFLSGRSSVVFDNISLKCANGVSAKVDAHSVWKFTRYQDLFQQTSVPCDKDICLKLSRANLTTDFVRDRDVADVDIGSGLHMSLPLAVWTDGNITYPHAAAVHLSPPTHTMMDLPVRLAAVATTWSTLYWFYPYFSELGIDWSTVLAPSLDEAARASTPEEVHRVLWRLVAASRDGHARVRHSTHSMLGMLPIALRRFGSQIIVVGGLKEYLGSIPIGSELLSIDGVPAEKAYAEKAAIASGATPQAHDYLSSLYMTLGPVGVLRNVNLRPPGNSEISIVLPSVSREMFDQDIHNDRPPSGKEIASGIFYLDMMQLNPSMMPDLLQSITTARALILDIRGYVTDEAYELLAHFILRPVDSPVFWIPEVTISHTDKMRDEGWVLRPAEPFFKARLIVLTDARAVSGAETFLQMVHDYHLATLVGEPTAGTNGDVNTFIIPGDFEVRFSGLHVSGIDGSTVQGHGIFPDRLVHPTLAGIRADRDEVLDAAVSIAQER